MTPVRPTRSAVVLGVPLDDLTLDDAVERIAEMVRSGRTTGRSFQVCTVNVDFVVNALHDDELLGILQGSDLALPDGAPLVWASRLQRTPVRTRVAGADLIRPLAARAARDGSRLCFFGGDPDVTATAAATLRAEHPGLDVTVVEAPLVPPDGTTDPDVVATIRELRPDIVCVALGNPKQERWIARYRHEVGAPVLVGIGGSLDFLVGRTQRAPEWMQRAGLEWLHRAAREPRRLVGRYARDIRVFVPRVGRALVAQRRPAGRRAASARRRGPGDGAPVRGARCPPTWPRPRSARWRPRWATSSPDGALVVELPGSVRSIRTIGSRPSWRPRSATPCGSVHGGRSWSIPIGRDAVAASLWACGTAGRHQRREERKSTGWRRPGEIGCRIVAASSREAPGSTRRLILNLLEAFFRRPWLFLLPIVISVAWGVSSGAGTPTEYRSVGTISATSESLLGDLTQAPSNQTFSYESPATVTARNVNELLRTNEFLTEVVDRRRHRRPRGLGDVPLPDRAPVGLGVRGR